MRLARRWKWTESDDPVKIEAEVATIFPKSEWTMLSHRVIFHGRRICHARKPACGACPITHLCPSYGEGETDPEKAAKLLKYEKGGFPASGSTRRPTTRAARRRPWARAAEPGEPPHVPAGRPPASASTRTPRRATTRPRPGRGPAPGTIPSVHRVVNQRGCL